MVNRAFPSFVVRFCCVVFAAVLLVSGLLAQKKPPQAEPPAPTPVPVVVDGRTLFELRAQVSSVPMEERAAAIAGHVVEISERPRKEIESKVFVDDDEGVSFVMFGESVVMSVTERDAKLAGKPRQALAQEYATTIRTAALSRNYAYSRTALIRGLWSSALATLVLALVIWFVRWAIRKLHHKLEHIRETQVQVLRLQKAELVSAERMMAITMGIVRALRWFATLACAYVYLTFLLHSFPWTQEAALVLWRMFSQPMAALSRELLSYLPNIVSIALVGVFTYVLIRLAKLFFTHVSLENIVLPGFYPDWAMPTFKIVRALLLAFGMIALFPYLPGSKSPAFQGVGIFVGALLSLGSTSVVANVVSGIVITYTRAFKIGDRVRIGEAFGDIVSKTMLVTRVRTVKNVEIAIPNALVLTTQVLNYSVMAENKKLILHTEVTIGYDTPWRQVKGLLLLAAERTQGVLKDPPPFVLQPGLSDFYVKYELNVYVGSPYEIMQIYSDLHENIQDAFNEYGVQIMSPHYMFDRDMKTYVPPEKWFEPPAGKPDAFAKKSGV